MEDLLIKAATLVAVGLATFSSFPGTARQDPPVEKTSPVQQKRPSAGGALSRPTPGIKPVTGEFLTRLDATSQPHDFGPAADK